MAEFIKALNEMLEELQGKYAGVVYRVNLLDTLPKQSDWANELHRPTRGLLPSPSSSTTAFMRCFAKVRLINRGGEIRVTDRRGELTATIIVPPSLPIDAASDG